MDFELDDDTFAIVQLCESGFPNITVSPDDIYRAINQLRHLVKGLRKDRMTDLTVNDDEIRILLDT